MAALHQLFVQLLPVSGCRNDNRCMIFFQRLADEAAFGQEIGGRRHLRTHLLREFQLRRREMSYTFTTSSICGNGTRSR
jgi:hypothetical protein